MLKSGSTMPGGGRIPSLTIIFLYWRWMWLGCLPLATILHFRSEKGITYRIIPPAVLLHLVRNELPLQFVHLSLHLVLGLQQFRAVLRPDDREVVLQAPMSQRQLTVSRSTGIRKLTRNDSARWKYQSSAPSTPPTPLVSPSRSFSPCRAGPGGPCQPHHTRRSYEVWGEHP